MYAGFRFLNPAEHRTTVGRIPFLNPAERKTTVGRIPILNPAFHLPRFSRLEKHKPAYEKLISCYIYPMRKYLRNYVEGGTYFLTQVTHNRFHYFSEPAYIDVCLSALIHVQKYHPFELVAYCILPDHLHLLITLPIDQKDFSTIMKEFKKKATKELRKIIGVPQLKIWQDRFWEHTIRNERDMQIHFDYIHYNPIKHLYVDDPLDWEWSSYGEYYDRLFSNRPKINPKSFEMIKQGFGE